MIYEDGCIAVILQRKWKIYLSVYQLGVDESASHRTYDEGPPIA